MTPTTSTPSTPSATQSPLALSASRTSSTGGRPHAVAYRKRKHRADKDALGSDNDCNDFSDDESSPKSGSPSIDDDRRAHHNELERRRRDHIKDHFSALKNSIPLLEGEKSSRALILKRAVDYITLLQAQIKEYKLEIEEVRRHNDALAQHTQIGLRPLISQLQLHHSRHSPTALQQDTALHHPQPTYASSHHVTSPSMPTSAAMLAAAQQQQQQRQQQMQSPQLPPYPFSSGTAMGHSVHPTSSINESKSPPSGFVPPSPPTFASNPVNSATQHFSDALQQLSRPSAPLDLAGLSQLLLQNPLLAAQLQQTSSQPMNIPHSSHSESASVTSPSSLSSLYGTLPTTTQTTTVSDHSVDTDARLLSSLALRERQLAAAIRL